MLTDQGSGIEANQLIFTNEQTILEQMHFHASGEYTFAAAPVKATLSAHHMTENFLNRFQAADTMFGNPPYLAAFNFEDSRLDMANLQVDYFPSFIDNYFLAGMGTRDTRIGEPASTGLSPRDTLPGNSTPLVGRYLYPPTGMYSFLRPSLHQNRLYVYAQDQQYLWEKRIQLTAGLRFDRNDIYGDILNFRSGIMLRPLPSYTFRGLFGQGFREPTIFDLVNADIEPARMNFWEASLLFNPVRHLSGQVAYYQNHASDLIVVDAAKGTFLPQNVGHKEVGGVESQIRYQVGPFGGDLWHSFEYSLDEQPLIASPENKMGFGVHYRHGEHLSLGLRGKYTSRADGLALTAERIQTSIKAPRYYTLDVNALARELEFAGVSWDLSFSIFNVLDRENLYVNTLGPNPNRYLAEGREFVGKVAVRF